LERSFELDRCLILLGVVFEQVEERGSNMKRSSPIRSGRANQTPSIELDRCLILLGVIFEQVEERGSNMKGIAHWHC